jgi:trehalose 6-phosphate synthase/phosphatase
MSSGGLVSALSGLKNEMNFIWIGWSGKEIAIEDQERVKEELMKEYSCFPVFLSDADADAHYNGFSNSILWPLFHYHPSTIAFDDAWYEAYKRCNMVFAEEIVKLIKQNDLVWVHDYHLCLLPQMLREMVPKDWNIKIGYFLHTPFPTSEIYRILPVRREILLGLLKGANLIGFHTWDYARHFMSSCSSLLSLSTTPRSIIDSDGVQINVGVFPIGIPADKFTDALSNPDIQSRIKELKRAFVDATVIVGVDRLDYIKGLPQKLDAFQMFLEQHPELRQKVILVQVAVPSREDVEEYQHLLQVVNQRVSRINGKYGTVEFTPIHFLHKSVNFEELVALYSVSSVCLVSSVRDGMNLVSFEYITSQQDFGTLILSEFAGAAQSLNGSILVNPWDAQGLANAIYDAVTMPMDQRKSNHKKLLGYVSKHTAAYWGKEFVGELSRLSITKENLNCTPFDVAELLKRFSAGKKRVLFLDDDGTLIQRQRHYDFAKPNTETLALLKKLSALPDTYVYVVSGRSRLQLESWYKDVGVGLVCELGCLFRHPEKVYSRFNVEHLKTALETQDWSPEPLRRSHSLSAVQKHSRSRTSSQSQFETTSGSGTPSLVHNLDDGWMSLLDKNFDANWKPNIMGVLEHYTERTPGSYIENKTHSLTWHFRDADDEFGNFQASELVASLEKMLGNAPVEVLRGRKILDLHPSLANKDTAARAILWDMEADFVLSIGDGRSDEALFAHLNKEYPETAMTVCVGVRETEAKNCIQSSATVLEALTTLSNLHDSTF